VITIKEGAMGRRGSFFAAAAATGLVTVALAAPAPALAASRPAPVSNLHVYARSFQQVWVSWSVPAAAYRGAEVVVRYAAGRRAPTTVHRGHAAVWVSYPHVAGLPGRATPRTWYSFAVWVRDQGRYSYRRTFTARTLARPASGVSPVAHLRVAARYDHTVRLAFDPPPEAYTYKYPVVRMTRGHTPAARPTDGYAVPLLRAPKLAQARPLAANTVYTFAVWVPGGGVGAYQHFSARRTITVRTRRDVTAPRALRPSVRADLVGATVQPQVDLSWTTRDPDVAGVRVLRTTSDWARATLLTASARGSNYLDRSAGLRRDTRYTYYLAARDFAGHLGPYVKVSVVTNARRIGGTLTRNADGYGEVLLSDATQRSWTVRRGATADDWLAAVPPGAYTVCEVTEEVPGAHFQFVDGCYTPGGIADWTGDSLPPGAAGAVQVGSADGPDNIDLDLHYY